MTEKQFTFNKDTVATNLKTPITYNNKTMSIGEVLEKLNELADENEQLKSTINTLTHDNTKMKKVLNTTKKENEHIKNTIKEAYKTERTDMGKSVLKQLLEAIQ